MNRKKVGLAAVLEIGALCAGIALLAYFACGDRGAVDVTREARVFSAARDGDTAGPAKDGAGSPRPALEELLTDLLARIATGAVTEERRGDVQRALIDVLERASWGKAENRESAAALVVQQMFDQLKQRGTTAELDLRQRRAIGALAQELTRQMLLTSTGASAGADAIAAPVPPGYERLTWNQLGGFPYEEGMQVPAEVATLRGRSVALPGFMLTLGDTEAAREFILIESLWGCCFGSVPSVNQLVVVRMAGGESAEYTAGPIMVSGVLEVGEEREGEYVTSLYRIREAEVQPTEAAQR